MHTKLEKEQQELDERLNQLEADKASFEVQQRKYEQENEALRNAAHAKGYVRMDCLIYKYLKLPCVVVFLVKLWLQLPVTCGADLIFVSSQYEECV